MERKFLKREPRLRAEERMWAENDSKVMLVVGILWLLIVVLIPIGEYCTRSDEDDFNLAARTYNALSLEERKAIADGFFSSDMSRFDDENYVFTEKHKAPRNARDILWHIMRGVFWSSLLCTIVYCWWSIAVGFFLADIPMRFPDWIPWLILLVLCWPFLVGSYVRLRKFRRGHGGDVVDATDV